MTFERKNNNSNDISVLKLVESEVLHNILGLLCQKFQIQGGRWFWPLDDLDT